METGPNDAKCVGWAFRKFFLYLFRVLLLLTSVFRYSLYMGRQRLWKRAQTTPNASFGPFVSFLFYFFRVLVLLMNVLGTIYLREGGDDENGPKRHQMRRLGHL